MRQGFRKRWATIFAASLWAFAALLQGLTPALSAFIPGPKTEIEAQAIDREGARRQGICDHHPQGCPADCFCPKTGFVDEAVSEDSGPSSTPEARLTEASWVECSETRAASAPAFAVYLPETSVEAPLFESPESSIRAEPVSAREVARARPAKVPIA
jgi:hypothetical protein